MKELRDKKYINALLEEITRKKKLISSPIRLMEVCGTHTMTIHKSGLKSKLEKAGIDLISGPGCPVCITPNEIHEAAIDLVAQNNHFILTTFGDMTRVPTTKGALQTIVPAKNSMIKIVYSPEESLEIAKSNQNKEVVFFGVGFETTIPSIALTIKTSYQEKIKNFSTLTAFWLIPPPLKAIVEAKDSAINGFIYPGHVSAIIGEKPYQFIADQYGISGAITGFEPGDILLAIRSILDQIYEKNPIVANEYSRVVKPSGNKKALAILNEMLETKDAFWRGLGYIPNSGLQLKKKFSSYDAEKKYHITISPGKNDLPGCKCGEVLRGTLTPPQCPLFASKCRPNSPYGPCMVSFEGACLAYYKYQYRNKK
ncbi:MAG: hydrogenase formation protein HypD [Candidatus Aminicenantaceae bacterium]